MKVPCPQCIERWGQEPSEWGDTKLELVHYFKHKVYHEGYTGEVPWFWKDEIYEDRMDTNDSDAAHQGPREP